MSISDRAVTLDPDLLAALQFMQDHIPASKLLAVSRGIMQVGGALWDKYPQEPITAIALLPPPVR